MGLHHSHRFASLMCICIIRAVLHHLHRFASRICICITHMSLHCLQGFASLTWVCIAQVCILHMHLHCPRRFALPAQIHVPHVGLHHSQSFASPIRVCIALRCTLSSTCPILLTCACPMVIELAGISQLAKDKQGQQCPFLSRSHACDTGHPWEQPQSAARQEGTCVEVSAGTGKLWNR